MEAEQKIGGILFGNEFHEIGVAVAYLFVLCGVEGFAILQFIKGDYGEALIFFIGAFLVGFYLRTVHPALVSERERDSQCG